MRKRIDHFQASPRRLLSVLLIFLFITVAISYVEGTGRRPSHRIRHSKMKCGNNGIKRLKLLFNHLSENFLQELSAKHAKTGHKNQHSVIEIESCGTNETIIHRHRTKLFGSKRYETVSWTGTRVRLRFVWRGDKYLCFNKYGRVKLKTNGDLSSCQFYEIPVEETIHVASNITRFDGTFVYRTVHDERWALGFRKKGKPLNGKAAFRRFQNYFDEMKNNGRVSRRTKFRFKGTQFSKLDPPERLLDSALNDNR